MKKLLPIVLVVLSLLSCKPTPFDPEMAIDFRVKSDVDINVVVESLNSNVRANDSITFSIYPNRNLYIKNLGVNKISRDGWVVINLDTIELLRDSTITYKAIK